MNNLFAPADRVVIGIADIVSKPEDQIRLIMCMIVQIILGQCINVFVPKNAFLRHMYNIVLGASLQIFMFRDTVYHIYIMAYSTYFLMSMFPRDTQHKYVIGFLLCYMSGQHCWAMYTDFGGFKMDVTTYTMILVTKLWGLTFAFKDGYMDMKQLTPDQVQKRVIHMPTLMEFSSYVFFVSGCIVGPFLEYSDYKNWIELEGVYKTLPIGMSQGWKSAWPAFKRFLHALGCLSVHVFFMLILGYDMYWQGTKEFLTYKTIFHRIAYWNMTMTGQKFMYYTPWCFTDSSCIACGIAYNGQVTDAKTGKVETKWDRIQAIYIWKLETASTPLQMMKFWNHQIHQWLNTYVQARVVTPGKKAGLYETFVTFTVSAFWHGFYPFYYFMFGLCACFVELAKDIYRARSLFDFIPAPFGHIITNILSMMVMNYCGVSFNQLTFERGGNFASGTYYLVWILVPSLLIIEKSIGLVGIAKKRDAKKLAKTQAKVQEKETKKDK